MFGEVKPSLAAGGQGIGMALVKAKVSIVGKRPLFWHHFGPDALPLEKKARAGVAGNNPEEWQSTVLKTADNQLYLEPSYLFGCIRNGAKFTRRGKGSFQSLVASTLQIVDDQILVDRWLPKNLAVLTQSGEHPVYLDIRSVTNPGTKGRNIRYRVAASTGWKATFCIAWDNSLIGQFEMESIVKDAGQFAGLGDGRTIGFGRFEVASFQLLEETKNAQKPTPQRALVRPAKRNMATG